MNKVFRIIWSDAQGAWIAVSERVKSHSKRSRKAALVLALASGSLMGLSGNALALGLGDFETPVGAGSIAIGSETNGCDPTDAAGKHSVSMGCEAGTFSTGDGKVSIGYQAGFGGDGNNNTSIGSGSGDTVKGSSNTALGYNAGQTTTGNSNAALGQNAGTGTRGDSNVGVGEMAGGAVVGDKNTAIGSDTGKTVQGDENTAIGALAGNAVIGDFNTAFGRSAGRDIQGDSNISLGNGAGLLTQGDDNIIAGFSAGQGIKGDNNIIMGHRATISSTAITDKINDTIVFGSNAYATVSNNVALGANAKAEHKNSVALGHASQTKEALQIDTAVITTDISATTGILGDNLTQTYGAFAGTASGVVSVGSVGGERQIINVAPGAISESSTDALNGSQLFNMATGINQDIYNLGDSVANSLGGDSSYVGGTVNTILEVGGNTYNNVQDALQGSSWTLISGTETDEVKAGDKVTLAAGKNMLINSTKDTDGNITSNFLTKDDVEFDSVTTAGAVMDADGVTVAYDDGTGTGTIVTGPSMTRTGINAGDLKITNVKAGIDTTDGVNVSQLKGMGDVIGGVTIEGDGSITGPTFNVNNTVNNTINEAIQELDKGWKFVAEGKTYQVQADDTVELAAGDNIEIAHDGAGKATVKTAENVNFTSVTTGTNVFNAAGLTMGNTFVSSDGLTFTNSTVAVKSTGINAGGQIISNVGAGVADSDGVNFGQLKGLGAKGWKLQVDGAPAVDVAPEATVGFNKGKNIVLTQNGTNVEIATADDVEFVSVKAGDSLLNNAGLQVGTGVFITNQGLQAGNTYVTNAGLTFAGSGVAVTAGGINAGGNTITNVLAGTAATDAVNVSQLKDVKDTAEKGWNISTNGGPAQNVAPDGKVDFEAGNNIQLTQTGTNIKVETTPDVTHTSVTTGQSSLDDDGLKVGANVAVTDTGLKAGGTSVTDAGLTFDGSTVAVGAGGIDAGGNQIKDVAAGTALTDGVNFGQLKDVEDKVNKGWKLTAESKSTDVGAGDEVTIDGSTNIKVTHDGAGKLEIATNPDVIHNSVTTNTVTTGDTVMNDNGITIVGGPSITKGGINAGDTKITNVKNGDVNSTSTDAINGSQLNETNNRVTINEGNITKNTGDITNLKTGKEGMFQVSQDYNAPAPKPTGVQSVAGGAGAQASGDRSTAIGNDTRATAHNSTALGHSASAQHNNSVALGQGSSTDREQSVSIGALGNERQLTHVAAGVAPTDGVNVSQLEELGGRVNQYFNSANKRIDKVDNNARAGIAAAMAAGALPQSTLPGKSMVTLGASTYRGETALAIGVSRLSDNARTVIKANGSADSRGHAGVAVGAGWHW